MSDEPPALLFALATAYDELRQQLATVQDLLLETSIEAIQNERDA